MTAQGDTGVCMIKRMGAALAAVALATAPVQAACWNDQEISAGTIRDFQSLLMVATLRCQVMHVDITADYNAFLNANKPTIQKMNERLKIHFFKAHGPVEGQRRYDGFATSLANAYGARQGNKEVCTGVASLAREAAMMAGSEEGLVLLAQRQGIATALPEGACESPAGSITVAAISPVSTRPAGPAD
ncbi:hypothetical protein Q4F19_03115 [Sphingomonas sp. BIUV-7]|uniref:S-adenosyl-L-homocysteine hydrolase n=1 Tax=Sphingomonas natans TaxID=3063330 RepID=A0ABT8Y4W2_9SPHN|nr:hypothetical protein [Sphingomonas sp. BIUV-7]MDO6413363.1 hypothetical protein [Sphingomonas sp. BIUV-7]